MRSHGSNPRPPQRHCSTVLRMERETGTSCVALRPNVQQQPVEWTTRCGDIQEESFSTKHFAFVKGFVWCGAGCAFGPGVQEPVWLQWGHYCAGIYVHSDHLAQLWNKGSFCIPRAAVYDLLMLAVFACWLPDSRSPGARRVLGLGDEV